ncbi:MAG: cytochrome C-binding protein [Sandarakinorhabdus sp.]|nr:cytochrome C-binding protein [Sandarakinorhabdus sp.]
MTINRALTALLVALPLLAAADMVGTDDWLYPAPVPAAAASAPANRIVGVPGSTVRVTQDQLHDFAKVVDWHPDSHPQPPPIILQAQTPQGYACGFCHMPGGEGRPENASLAGLPLAYIIAQTKAFRGGTRHSARADWFPTTAMQRAITAATDAEIAQAAGYFSQQPFRSRLAVVETATVPATRPLGYILAPVDGPREPIAGRIIEVPDDLEAFENRDSFSRFTAYVPPGSIARGEAVADRIGCLACHDEQMGGWGPGRSPSYVLRQLRAFKSNARADADAAPMQAVVEQLSPSEMVDVSAWLADQPPRP